MNSLTLSIMPTLHCDYNCPYCYLGDKRKDKSLLDLYELEKLLDEIRSSYRISVVNLYGGELSLLNHNYLNDLLCAVCTNRLSLTTNLQDENIINFCLARNVKINVSLNEERDHYKETLSKVRKYKNTKIMDLSVVVLPSLVKKKPSELYKFYNDIGLDVLFIQYHKSINNQLRYDISLEDYSNFLYEFILEYKKHDNPSFNIENLMIYNDKLYRPNIDSYLFINNKCKLCTVTFKDGIERYIEFDSLSDWQKYCHKENERYKVLCSSCKLFGRCKAEHLETFNNTGECSGLKCLLNKLTYKNICSLT